MFRTSLSRHSFVLDSRIHPVRRRYALISSKTHARMDRVIKRMPRFVRPYVSGLKVAPVSHIISFLILHELTAIIPLVGFSLGFYYTGWMPPFWTEGRWISEGIDKFGRYFEKKQWFGFRHVEADESSIDPNHAQDEGYYDIISGPERAKKIWSVGKAGTNILSQVAMAYAITKALLPARIALSVWSTPWFSRVVVGGLKGLFIKG